MTEPHEKASSGPIQRHVVEIAIGAAIILVALAVFILPDLRNRAVAIFTRGAVTKMTVSGRVTDDKGAPVSGATVHLEGMGKAFTGTADSRGEYRIHGVDAGSYDASGVAPGFVHEVDFMGGRSRLAVTPGTGGGASKSRLVHDLRLKPGCAMTLKLKDESGKPVTGASILLYNPSWRPFGGAFEERVTDRGDGSYLIDGLPEESSPYQFIVVHTGYVPTHVRKRMDRAGEKHEAELTLGAGVAVNGTVQDAAGNPVAGIEVSAKPDWWPEQLRHRASQRLMRAGTRTPMRSRGGSGAALVVAPAPPPDPEQFINSRPSGPDGKFTIPHVLPGTYTVWAITRRGGGRSASGRHGVTLPPPDGNLIVGAGSDSTSHRAGPGGADTKLHGSVVAGDSGRPVKKFSTRRVVTRIFGQRGEETPPDEETKEHQSETGTFEVDLPPQSFVGVQVLAEGMAEAWGPDTMFNPPSEPISIKLVPAAKATGRVVDPEGRPVAGAKVIPGVRITRELQLRQQGGGLREPVEGLIPVHPGGAAETDAEGRFTLDHLAAGETTLRVRHHDWVQMDSGPVTLVAEQATDVGSLTVSFGETVEGYLLDEQGRPVSGETISVGEEATGTWNGGREYNRAVTDTGGYFSLNRLPTKKLVIARAEPRGGSPSHFYSLYPLAKTTAFEFGHGPCRVTGRLLTNGLPRVQTPVTLGGQGGAFMAVATTDNEGRFAFHGVPPGRHRLSYRINPPNTRVGPDMLRDLGRTSFLAVIEVSGEAVELGDLDQKLGTLTLKIVEDPGRPVTDAWLMLTTPDGGSASFHNVNPQRDLDDTIVVHDLPAGTYRVQMHGVRSFGGGRFNAVVDFDPGQAAEPVVLDMRAGTGKLTLKATGGGGAYYSLTADGGSMEAMPIRTRGGPPTYSGLRAGRYRLFTFAGKPVESVEPIDLGDGEEKTVEVTLPGGGNDGPRGSVKVLVLDDRGLVIEGPDASLRSGDAEHEGTQTGGGHVGFLVPPGEYTLIAGFPGYEQAEEPVAVRPGEAERAVVVSLKKRR